MVLDEKGCILSPMLFNLYLNEIPTLLDTMDTDPIILPDGSKLNCLLHADDLILISYTSEGLQRSLDTLSKFCNDWLLNINLKKTSRSFSKVLNNKNATNSLSYTFIYFC